MKKFIPLLLLPLLTSCTGERLEIENPRVREPVPGRGMTVAYMTLRNNGAESCELEGIQSGRAGLIEVHEHLHLDGRMAMRKVDKFSVGPATEVKFQPGGLHLMVMKLAGPLQPGDVLKLRFDFGECGKIARAFPVEPLT